MQFYRGFKERREEGDRTRELTISSKHNIKICKRKCYDEMYRNGKKKSRQLEVSRHGKRQQSRVTSVVNCSFLYLFCAIFIL